LVYEKFETLTTDMVLRVKMRHLSKFLGDRSKYIVEM